MKSLFSLAFLILSLCASETIFLENSLFTPITSVKKSVYVEDFNGHYTAEEILNMQDMPLVEKNNIGYSAVPVWTKFLLKNSTDYPMNIILFNPRNGIDTINTYIFSDGSLKKHYLLGDAHPPQKETLSLRHNALSFFISPKEEITIITQIKHSGLIETRWLILDFQSFTSLVSKDTLIIGLFAGLMIALILYNISIFILLRWESFLYSSLYAFCLLIQQLSSSRLLYEVFHSFIPLSFLNNIGLWAATTSIIFIFIFHKKFLEIDTYFSPLFVRLTFWVPIVILFAILFIELININFIEKNLGNLVVIFLIMLSLLPLIGIVAMLKKISGSSLYVLAQTSLIISLLVQFYLGMRYAIIVGFSLNIIFLSLALAHKMNLLQKAMIRSQRLLTINSRLASMGQLIGNITHQWKVPLVKLGSIIMEMEMYATLKEQNTNALIKNLIPQLRQNLNFMNDTIKEFYAFYQKDLDKNLFLLKDEIDRVLNLLKGKQLLANATIEVKEEMQNLQIKSYPHSFAHLMMILIDNALNVAIKRRIKSPLIQIDFQVKPQELTLLIKDNCGGIMVYPLESIFDATEQKEPQQGLGLSIARTIVDFRLEGSISVHNDEYGAVFTIKIPLSNQ